MGNCLKRSRTSEPIFMPDDEDDDDDANPQRISLGQNQPLIHEPVEWESDVPLTEGQLRGKRDTFWETAPMYEGRKEVWDALKAAAEAAESEEYELAQAIITGAGILLPRGKLTDVYDDWGNRYIIPKYCLSRPVNMLAAKDSSSAAVGSASSGNKDQVSLKIRLSTQQKDFKCVVMKGDSVAVVKQRIEESHRVNSSRLKMFLSGRLLLDDTLVGDLDIPRGFVIQAIVT